MADARGKGWIIDADTHITEPPDVWVDRVPERFRDRVPHVERSADGIDQWMLDGAPIYKVGLTATAGWAEPFPGGPSTYEECHPASYDSHGPAAVHGRGGDLGAGAVPERRVVRWTAVPLRSPTTS